MCWFSRILCRPGPYTWPSVLRRLILRPRRSPSIRSLVMLRPFFGYYGGKWRDALKLYPAPWYRTIVEPFAGSAGYSLRYPDCQVILCEKDPVLVQVWDYLIRVSPAEILGLPDVPLDGSVDDVIAPQEAKLLIGFWLNRGTSGPRKRPSKWMRDQIRPGSFWGERVRQTIASQVVSIRHWKVYECSYELCPTTDVATWFVDPPYQFAGKHYRYGSGGIDYGHLGEWCKERPGEVIVCENGGAKWLEFEPLAHVKTTRRQRQSEEVIWHCINQPVGEQEAPRCGAAGDKAADDTDPGETDRAAIRSPRTTRPHILRTAGRSQSLS